MDLTVSPRLNRIGSSEHFVKALLTIIYLPPL